jgi:hypothetical protein
MVPFRPAREMDRLPPRCAYRDGSGNTVPMKVVPSSLPDYYLPGFRSFDA